MYTNILEIKHLKKSYGQIKAVDDISFEVRKGSLFAFLGQNGAGKSTTINVITTLLNKDEGEVLINGRSEENYIRTKIGVVFQENVSDDLLTVKENLISRGVLYLKEKQAVEERYQEIIEILELKDLENRKYKTLSGGQKRRVEIARALFSDPEILILDEPTTGLDPETRQLVWQVLEKLQKEKSITIFLTTHYMEEAAKADYVVIIHKGKVIAKGSPSELKNAYSKDYFKIVPKDKHQLTAYLEKEKKVYKKVSDQYLIEVESAQETINLILELKENIKTFEVIKGTLDDVFIHVIGEQNV